MFYRGVLAAVAACFAFAPAMAEIIVRDVTISPASNGFAWFGSASFDPFIDHDGDTLQLTLHFTQPVRIEPIESSFFQLFATIAGGVDGDRYSSSANVDHSFQLFNATPNLISSGGRAPLTPNQGFGLTSFDINRHASTDPAQFDGVRFTYEITGNAAGVPQNQISFNFQSTPGVPEPATWTLMIVGLGLSGVGLRRTARRDWRLSTQLR